jgi:hypothetical protein
VSAVACAPPGSDTRFGSRPIRLETNASTFPLVSPATRFEAELRNATHEGTVQKLPSTAAPQDGPLAGPPGAREISVVLPRSHFEPLLWNDPARRTTNTSLTPLPSPLTRLDASDSNAM